MAVIFFKADKEARRPGFAHKYDAGIDLFAKSDETIGFKPFEIKLIKTGLYFKIPNNYVGIIKDRSGIALKTPFLVKAGVIDPSYRGEVGIVLQNVSDQEMVLEVDNPIAQMIVCQLPTHITLNDMPEAFNETDRGENGFGSTDIKNDIKNQKDQ